MTKQRHDPVDDLIREGLDAIEASFTLAKASQGDEDGGSLDDDLKDFDESKSASDDAMSERDEDEDEDEGEADGHEGDADWNGGKASAQAAPGEAPPMAKAVDALPLLEAIEGHLGILPQLLERIEALEASNATLAKAVQDQSRGTHLIAKAVSGRLNSPLPAKSKGGQLAVPVRGEAPQGADRSTVMNKCITAVEQGRLDVESIATFEVLTNQRGVDAALIAMPQVAAAIGARSN